uniref:Strictosidine synthase conserved region domain-containing protein n=1 Tax=Oryza meridionalis TaxID=40149 RepID=A0A0E0C922_9ORYZ
MRATLRPTAAATALALILFLVVFSPSPAAAAAARMFKTIDARRSRHLDLGGSLVGPESVAFDGKGRGPYSGVSDGRIMRWNGEAAGWSTYTYSPSYTKNKCAASTLPTVQTESKCGRYPDNVRPDGKGGYWIALHREKYELPFGPDNHLVAMRVSAGGKLVQQMRGPKSLRPTEVMERKDGEIYMGNVELPYVGVVKSTYIYLGCTLSFSICVRTSAMYI